MKNFNVKSKKGFTLIELLVVIGILAVLAAIAIPSVAGLIDRANVSADETNANEMTNALERFASEYELYCQDIASAKVDINNLDSAQGRVYKSTRISKQNDIDNIEVSQNIPSYETVGPSIYRDTKYPTNVETVKLIIENYMKTSFSTFEPKQSDCHYYYSPDCGIVVCTEVDKSEVTDLNKLVISGKDAKGNELDEQTQWIDITTGDIVQDMSIDISTVNPTLAENDWKTIHKVVRNGKVGEVGWKVGDLSPEFEINGQIKRARIIGIDQDGKNTVTFMLTGSIGRYRMSGEYNDATNIGGFANSEENKWLNKIVFNNLSSDLKMAIKTTNKKSTIDISDKYNTSSCNYKLFLPSIIEVGLFGDLVSLYNYTPNPESVYEKESDFTYTYFSENVASKIMQISSNTNIQWWSLRTSYVGNDNCFFAVVESNLSHNSSILNADVVPLFVIG